MNINQHLPRFAEKHLQHVPLPNWIIQRSLELRNKRRTTHLKIKQNHFKLGNQTFVMQYLKCSLSLKFIIQDLSICFSYFFLNMLKQRDLRPQIFFCGTRSQKIRSDFFPFNLTLGIRIITYTCICVYIHEPVIFLKTLNIIP